MKHVGIKIKFYNPDTFKKQSDVNFIDLDSELVDLNYKVAYFVTFGVPLKVHSSRTE